MIAMGDDGCDTVGGVRVVLYPLRVEAPMGKVKGYRSTM